jgi:O-6-methylguanine DNA methyltransferase
MKQPLFPVVACSFHLKFERSSIVMTAQKKRPEKLFFHCFEAHPWKVGAASTELGLAVIEFPVESKNAFRSSLSRRFENADIVENEKALGEARRQIEEYLQGRRTSFTLPIDLRVTTFQRRVLKEVAKIPFGKTLSYGEVARRIGKPQGARAVGSALHRNPIPLVIPCHRVIGSDGSLVGFGGGVHLKAYLLDFEGAAPKAPTRR